MTEPTPRLRAGDTDRDATIEQLQRAYSNGRLTLDEFNDRRDSVLATRYLDELSPLVADLPEGLGLAPQPGTGLQATQWRQPPSAVTPTAYPAPAPYAASTPLPATAGAGNLPVVSSDGLPFSLTVMSGRDVRLAPGSPGVRNFAWWGGDNYNLVDALGPGRTVVLELHAIMAGSTIYVPEGVRVIDECLAIMAGNTVRRSADGDGSNGTLILRGFLWWGGHTVKLAKGQRAEPAPR